MPIPSQEIIEFLEDARAFGDRLVTMCSGALDIIEGRTVRVDMGVVPDGASVEMTTDVVPATAPDVLPPPGPIQCGIKGCGTILIEGKCPRCGWVAANVEENRQGEHAKPSPTQCPNVGCAVELLDGVCPRCNPPTL